MSFSSGGGSSTEVDPTEADVAELESLETRLQSFEQNYFPLEQESIKEAFDPSVKEYDRSTLRGKVNADVMQAEKELTPAVVNSLRQGNASTAARDITKASANAQATGFKDADILTQDRSNQRQLNVVRTGEGKGRAALRGLRDLSRIASSNAINKLQNKQAKREGNARAITTLVNGATKAYGAHQNQSQLADLRAQFPTSGG